jgi:hypothetical protein
LIDASAGLTQDDLVVVQALYQAGASAMVLISKADLFTAAERQQMISYVKANLRDQLRIEPPVHAVSIFGADAALCDRWFESELRPFLARHHELAIISQKRKIGALREAVIGALARRLEASSEEPSAESVMVPEDTTEALRNGERTLERAQGECFFLTRKITKMQRAIIDVAAERIAAALVKSDDVDAPSIFGEALTQMIAEPVAATLRAIEHTRDTLADAMNAAASASGGDAPEGLPQPTGMPMIDVIEISQKIVVEKPRLISLLGKGALAWHIQRKLEAKYDRALLEFLSLYANRLRRWMEQSINELRNAFTAFADMHRAHFEAAATGPAWQDSSTIENDLGVLQAWT